MASSVPGRALLAGDTVASRPLNLMAAVLTSHG